MKEAKEKRIKFLVRVGHAIPFFLFSFKEWKTVVSFSHNV